tara:strand:- start:2653 stop:2886 length:234 start_codon:yes stop_codon:yes gene_type:complete
MVLGKKDIEQTVKRLEESAFKRWYSGNDAVFNNDWYYEKFKCNGRIKELLLAGYDVRTGYVCTSIRECHDYLIFYKK